MMISKNIKASYYKNVHEYISIIVENITKAFKASFGLNEFIVLFHGVIFAATIKEK